MLAALWGLSVWALPRLPARVPMHWNLQGQVDGWSGPLAGALLLPALATGTYLLILAFDWGRLDFLAARAMAPATTRQVRLLVLLLLGALHGANLTTAVLGRVLPFNATLVVLCLFSVLLGNLMPRLEPNAWVGIRVPPTLEDREVWRATHRRAGDWMVLAGLLGLPLSLLPERWSGPLTLPVILLPLLAATVLAYRLRARRVH